MSLHRDLIVIQGESLSTISAVFVISSFGRVCTLGVGDRSRMQLRWRLLYAGRLVIDSRRYFPRNCGLRFSLNARIPSRRSSVSTSWL
jgi:hypothetical protein